MPSDFNPTDEKPELSRDEVLALAERLKLNPESVREALNRSRGFSARLAQTLTDQDLSIGQAASLCNVSRSALEKYLHGQRMPSYEALVALSIGLNLPPNWLIFGSLDAMLLGPTGHHEMIIPAHVREISERVLSRILAGLARHIQYITGPAEQSALADAVKTAWPRVAAGAIADEYAARWRGDGSKR